MLALPEYDAATDGERGYALYCEILRLRHETARSRRIAALAAQVADIARRAASLFLAQPPTGH